ncbi:hypothetical protein M431DRAFT_271643 [Trichoderma harzianum CBS 226.95]|uniref:Uncharacterized protein n=1 Tax=Trichoderma harzianum CBS 226.95 TaxID=983964 RepID=A0A2T3ZXV9_TRIHA|nr:hypothetical protein M431DRAFT_271643 [Trichoderma harzianum CBS 226.95]PTB49639.1 hypothetical protein M431DRAFT_271643 [Trichoderma harzianum CBS 226.95]
MFPDVCLVSTRDGDDQIHYFDAIPAASEPNRAILTPIDRWTQQAPSLNCFFLSANPRDLHNSKEARK